jgi:molecular chaperone GrpE
MSDSPRGTARVRVSDKRRTRPDADVAPVPEEKAVAETAAEPAQPEPQQASAPAPRTYLEDLQRLQAEFENYRKRMMREQTEIASRAAAGLIERLLPVVDNLDRALAHEVESGGLTLIRKELMDVLGAEGLEEIPALGERFDPHLHEAVESHEDANVSDPVCSVVYRSGYKLKGKVLRPAMVGVARPPEAHEASGDDVDSGPPSSAESTS